jgi:hypothetical protein
MSTLKKKRIDVYYNNANIKPLFGNVMLLSILNKSGQTLDENPNIDKMVNFMHENIMKTHIYVDKNIIDFKFAIEHLKQEMKYDLSYETIDTLLLHYSGHGACITETSHHVMSFKDDSILYTREDYFPSYNYVEFVNFQLMSMFKKLKLIVIIHDSCRGEIKDKRNIFMDYISPEIPTIYMNNVLPGDLSSVTKYGSVITQLFFDYFIKTYIQLKKDVVKTYMKIEDILKALHSAIKENDKIDYRKKHESYGENANIVVDFNQAVSNFYPDRFIDNLKLLRFIDEINNTIILGQNKTIDDMDKIMLADKEVEKISTHRDVLNTNIVEIVEEDASYIPFLNDIVHTINTFLTKDSDTGFTFFNALVNHIYNNELTTSLKTLEIDQNSWHYFNYHANKTIYDEYETIYKKVKESNIVTEQFLRIRNIYMVNEIINIYKKKCNQLVYELFVEDESLLYDIENEYYCLSYSTEEFELTDEDKTIVKNIQDRTYNSQWRIDVKLKFKNVGDKKTDIIEKKIAMRDNMLTKLFNDKKKINELNDLHILLTDAIDKKIYGVMFSYGNYGKFVRYTSTYVYLQKLILLYESILIGLKYNYSKAYM